MLDLGAAEAVAYSRKVDFQSGYTRYHRLTKIHCSPGRYIETCSNYAKRRVHRNLHMNSGPLPEATPYVQTWIAKVQCIAKVHVYSCVSKWINRQPNLHLICLCSKDVTYVDFFLHDGLSSADQGSPLDPLQLPQYFPV